MSFVFDSAGTVKYLTSTLAGLAYTENITQFFWIKATTLGKFKVASQVWSDDTGALLARCATGINGSNSPFTYAAPYGSAAMFPVAGDTISADSWRAVCSRASLGGAATAMVDGGTEATASSLAANWGDTRDLDNFYIGADHSGGGTDTSQTFRLAHVAIWQVALSNTDRDLLLAGANPLAVNAANLLEYWTGASLTGYNSTVLSWAGGTGTVNDADNPTVDDPPGGSTDAGGMLLSSRRNRLTIP